MKKLLSAILFLAVFLPLHAKDIVLYHTSDTHGYYFATQNNKGQMQGGMPALAAFIKADSAHNPNYLLLDSGDFLQGNLEANKSKGHTSVDVFNAVGYSALTIGNHEFDFGTELTQITPLLNADVLVANFYGIPNTKPYKIYEFDGTKIAVIGIGLNGEKNKTYKELDIYSSYKTAIEAAYKDKPDAVVLLIHSSDYDLRDIVPPSKLVKSNPLKVNVSLGGHMHANKINTSDKVLYVETGTRTQNVSKVVLTFDDETGAFKTAKATRIPLLISKTGEDPEVKNLTEKIRNTENEKLVAQSKYRLLFESDRKKVLDNQLSNFLASALLKEIPADFALLNTKNFRANIPRGDVRVRDITQTMPYDNKLAFMKLKGSFIEELVKSSLTPEFSLFQFGERVKIKAVFRAGKLESVKIKINGKPLDPEKIYNVATNDFLAFAGTYEAEVFNQIPLGDKHRFDKSMKELLLESLNDSSAKKPKTGYIKVKIKK